MRYTSKLFWPHSLFPACVSFYWCRCVFWLQRGEDFHWSDKTTKNKEIDLMFKFIVPAFKPTLWLSKVFGLDIQSWNSFGILCLLDIFGGSFQKHLVQAMAKHWDEVCCHCVHSTVFAIVRPGCWLFRFSNNYRWTKFWRGAVQNVQFFFSVDKVLRPNSGKMWSFISLDIQLFNDNLNHDLKYWQKHWHPRAGFLHKSSLF